MAQVIAPEVWQEGIDDNRLLPNRYTLDIFTGSGVKIANNFENGVNVACRVYDMQVTDYITDYDDRRLNGLGGPANNQHGADGWSASSYGVFQDVRWDSRIYTMSRHRSIAMRIFDEMQYAGNIGEWGDATSTNVITPGQSLMKTAATLSKAKEIWEKEVLGPDIDRYNLFAVINGHISGRWVQTNPDTIFSDDGTWVAQPGPVQGQAIPPRFAPIHAIEWDDNNIPLLLNTIKVTWNNLFIPQDNRVFLIDPLYEIRLMQALIGSGVPATDAAYADMRDGSFTRLMGWDFRFDIPSQYWPRIWVDDNLNVVHSETADAAYDAIINSTNHAADGDKQLMLELADADRMNRPNYVRTVWDPATGLFKKIVTNYPLGMPAATDYLGTAVKVAEATDGLQEVYGQPADYPWSAPGSGYGLPEPTGPVLEKTGRAARRQVIGMAVYRPAAQLSQEYSEMRTAEGETRGKFTEMVMDVKYDAWVIESLSHGILPIIDAVENTGTFAIPVKPVDTVKVSTEGTSDVHVVPGEGTVSNITATPSTMALAVGQQASPVVEVTGEGEFDQSYTAFSSNTAVATYANGQITGVSAGTATITFRANGDTSKTAVVNVTVS